MASLQRIRNHGALVITVVGIAMLAFILGDALTHSETVRTLLSGNNPENVGVISGHSIHYTEYEAAQKQLEDVYRTQTGQKEVSEEVRAQMRTMAWQMFLMDYTLREQGEQIGMGITQEELREICFGKTPYRSIQSHFGQVSGEDVERFVENLNNASDDQKNEDYYRFRSFWQFCEKEARIYYLQDKYTTLFQHLLKANSLDAEFAFDNRQHGVAAEYVAKPYYTIADSLVTVSESDIKKLYKEHKPLYKQEPNRAIEYVVFDVVPSEADYQEAYNQMAELQEEFRTAANINEVGNDQLQAVYDGRDYSEQTVPAQYKDFAFAKGAKAGDCTEILFADDTYEMVRIMKAGYALPDSVELKVINAEGEDQELGWYSEESIRAILNDPAAFGMMDTWKEVLNKAFVCKRGERFTVEQGMGELTFQVTDVAKATPKVKLAFLTNKVGASNKTASEIYNRATQLAVNSKNPEDMEAAAQEAGMAVIPQYNLTAITEKVGRIEGSREIVKWAYKAKEGQVSEVFTCNGQKQYVVAALTEVNDGEYRSLESVRAELTREATAKAKAAYVAKQLKDVESLQQAAEIMQQPVQSVDRVSMADSRFGNAGLEPAVIGKTMALGENALSGAIEGKNGVFVVKTGVALNTTEEFNAEAEKAQLASRYAYLPYQAMQLIQDEAEIKDNRANFQ